MQSDNAYEKGTHKCKIVIKTIKKISCVHEFKLLNIINTAQSASRNFSEHLILAFLL